MTLLDYHVPIRKPLPELRFYRAMLWLLLAYFVISIATMPFVNWWWIGELPVLALFQLPKVLPAEWLRDGAVMPLIRLLGLSRGSTSPDMILARPYALALAYLLPLGALLVIMAVRKHWRGNRRLVLMVLALAVLDYGWMLLLAGRGGLSLY